jgi:Sec-independent protein translocase protein TatA
MLAPGSLEEQPVELGPLGLSELIFIALLALVIFGPRRLPEIGHAAGKLVTRLRRATADLRRTWETEVDEESRRTLSEVTGQIRSAGDELRAIGQEAWKGTTAPASALREAIDEARAPHPGGEPAPPPPPPKT